MATSPKTTPKIETVAADLVAANALVFLAACFMTYATAII